MYRNLWLTGSLAALICMSSWNSQQAYAQGQESLQSTTDREKQLSRERIEQESNQASQRANTRPVAEALSAVDETKSALKLLDENRSDQAKSALERALGKTDIVLYNHPNLALVPFAVNVLVIDTSPDEDTVKQVTGEAKNLVNSGLYQTARILLRGVASEIDVTSANLPIATYPNAIRSASHLIDQGKPKEAKVQLLGALQHVVITQFVIPLPIVRAQALIDDVNQQVESGKIDKVQANQLVTDADQQLVLAEKLGYGNRKQDYADLHTSIKNLKNTLNKDQDSKGLLSKIKQSLESLKEKVMGASTKE